MEHMELMTLNYMTKILALRAAGVLSIHAGYQDLYVEHDDDCSALAGIPECTCDPNIRLDGKLLKLPKYH
jgi:hypothetical protein